MIDSGVEKAVRGQAGVAVYIYKKWRNRIIRYAYVSKRVITLQIIIERGIMTIIGVYAPEEGRKEGTQLF